MLRRGWMERIGTMAMLLLAGAWAPGAEGLEPPQPPPESVVEQASKALGGPAGGHAALEALPGYRVSYRMEANDTMAGRSYTADHVYERGADGSLRLEVTLVRGDGENSIAYTGTDGAWVEVEGNRTEFKPEEVRARVDDFALESLYQVPLDLAVRGMEALPEEVRDRLETEYHTFPDEPPQLVVRAVDDDGVEQVRLAIDEASGHLRTAIFASIAGRIEYRFADYQEVSEGLILPRSRTFLRDGVLLSALTLKEFEVVGEDAEGPKKPSDHKEKDGDKGSP